MRLHSWSGVARFFAWASSQARLEICPEGGGFHNFLHYRPPPCAEAACRRPVSRRVDPRWKTSTSSTPSASATSAGKEVKGVAALPNRHVNVAVFVASSGGWAEECGKQDAVYLSAMRLSSSHIIKGSPMPRALAIIARRIIYIQTAAAKR